MENNLYIFLFILAGVAWIILALFVLSIFRGIARLRTPKPRPWNRYFPHPHDKLGTACLMAEREWEREWEAIEENLRK